MKRIVVGILTVWHWICRQDNYGSLLQAYASQTALERLGCDVTLLRCASEKEEAFREQLKSPFYYWLKYMFATNAKKRRRARERYFQVRYPRRFMEFARKNLKCSEQSFALEDFAEKDFTSLDAIVVGSDQVWAGGVPAYFLVSDKLPAKRIAYAASREWEHSDGFDEVFRRWGVNFTAISTREHEGVAQCHACGREDAVWVLDPTLLLLMQDWQKVCDAQTVPQGGVCAYFVSKFSEKHQCQIESYASRHQKSCWKVAVQGAEGDLKRAENALWLSPAQWLSWMSTANQVVTNSFHGLCFAIIFHRPFVVYSPIQHA